MEAIEKYLVKSLITAPKNDKEIGFNTALITVLKGIADGVPLDSQEADFRNNESTIIDFPSHSTDEKFLKFNQLFKEASYFVTDNDLISVIPIDDLHNIYINLIGRNKLYCVKKLKELTGLGLKEAKDIIDNLDNELIKIKIVETKLN